MRTKKEALTEQKNAILAQIADLTAQANALQSVIDQTPADAPSGEYEPGMFQELNDFLEQTGRKDAERARGIID